MKLEGVLPEPAGAPGASDGAIELTSLAKAAGLLACIYCFVIVVNLADRMKSVSSYKRPSVRKNGR